jgi:hypothetical protein
MGNTERTDLAVGFTVAVQQQEVGNSIVGERDIADLSHDRDASHDEHAGQAALSFRTSSGDTSSGAAPRWTMAGLSFLAHCVTSERLAVRNSADTFDGGCTAAATLAAASTESSRGNSSFPTSTPM